MAPSCSKHLSQEIINGLRLRLLIDKASVALRKKFHQYFPIHPVDLYNQIYKQKIKLQKLVHKKVISKKQLDILLPSSKQTDSNQFDITLLTFSLRQLCKLPEPVTGWFNNPLSKDQSDSANLVRIRIARNELQHHYLHFDNQTYTNLWNKIGDALIGLGCTRQELISLQTATLDPNLALNYQKTMCDLQQALDHVKNLEDSLDGFIYNVLPSIPTFVGREEDVKDIHHILINMDKTKLALVITGLGGVGKSEITRQYVQQLGVDYYKGNIIWINGENINSIADDFRTVAEQLKLTIDDDSGQKLQIETIVTKVYRFFANRSVLFIFDNVLDYKYFLKFIIPSSATKATVLVTTQLTEWSQRFVQKRLTVLSKESALLFCSTNLENKHIISPKSCEMLCEQMQYLPLALQQAVAYIERCSVTVDDYLLKFKTQGALLLSIKHDDETYEKTVLTTWKMALQKLKEENCTLAITLLHMMSYLDGKNIVKELFLDYYDHCQVYHAISMLQKYSLITLFTAYDDLKQTIILHSLLQHVIRLDTGNKNNRYLIEFLEMIFMEPYNENMKNVSYGKHWWFHVVYMFDNCKNITCKELASVIFKNMKKLVVIFASKGKQEMFYEILETIKEILPTLSPLEISNVRFYQALCLEQSHKYNEAIELLVSVETVQLEMLGTEHEELLKTKHIIGNCLFKMNKYEEAILILENAEELQIKHLGKSHPDVLKTQNDIATCLFELDSHVEAYQKLSNVEEKKIKVFGIDHPSVLKTKHTLADFKLRLGNYDCALKKYLEVEKQNMNVLGRNHPNVINTQHAIASCLEKQKKYTEALKKYKEIKNTEIEVFGLEHQNVISTEMKIALCLQEMQCYTESLELSQKLLQAISDRYALDHSYNIQLKTNVSKCYEKLNQYNNAIESLNELKELLIHIHGIDHVEVRETEEEIDKCLVFHKMLNDFAII